MLNTNNDVIITGATGFLGSHLLYKLLSLEYYKNIYLIVRGSESAAIIKLKKSFNDASLSYKTPLNFDDYLHRIVILNGDIEKNNCNVDYTLLNKRYDFWHLAAALNFENSSEDLVMSSNLQGTLNILDLVSKINIENYFHVSTAYSAGLLTGLIPEEAHDKNIKFANFYEKSKCLTEHYVIDFCKTKNLNFKIFRPSIVIGNSETKKNGGAWSTLYMFLKQLYFVRNHLKSTKNVIRINGKKKLRPNLIPVNDVIIGMLDISKQETDQYIYHLTSSSAPTLDEMVSVISEKLGFNNLVVEEFDTTESSPMEVVLAKQVEIYGSYLLTDKNFQRSLFKDIHISVSDFSAFISEGLKCIKKESVSDIFTYRNICGNNVYIAGINNLETIYIENAYGMPIDLLIPLTKRLSELYKVIISPLPILNKEESTSIDIQTQRIFDILYNLNVDRVNLISWCSGSGPILNFANKHSSHVQKIVILNGSYTFFEDSKTNFEKNMSIVMPKVAHNFSYANVLYNVIYSSKNGNTDSSVVGLTDSYINSTDNSLFYLTSQPFESPESLHSYGKYITSYIDMNHNFIQNINNDALILTGSNDITASTESNKLMCELIGKNASFEVLQNADHFMLYQDIRCHDRIVNFLS